MLHQICQQDSKRINLLCPCAFIAHFEQVQHNIQHSIVFRGVFRTMLQIYDGAICENSQRLKTVNYFYKKLKTWMTDWVLSMFQVFIHNL